MESDQSIYVFIDNLLPFMNKSYLEAIFRSKKLYSIVSNMNIINHNDIPGRAKIFFNSVSNKEIFISSLNLKNYDYLDYPISINDSEKTELLSEENEQLTEIKFVVNYKDLIETSYERNVKEKGLIFNDKQIIAKQSQAISFLIRKIGSNLLKGQSIMSISLPVNIFDGRTLLQVLAYEMSLAPYYLTKAFYSESSLTRLKWVTTFLLSQLHLSTMQTKPFSPTIGETFQCTIGDLNIYIEQTLHKPLSYNFYMICKIYKIYGYLQCDASTGANSIKANKIGKFIVEFQDGHKFRLYYPQIEVNGTTMGKRLFNFKHIALVCDEKNNLVSYIQFNPDAKGMFMSLFSSAKTLPDTFNADVKIETNSAKHVLLNNSPNSLSVINGEWSKFLTFDSIYYYWNKNEYDVIPLRKMKYILPSDSSFREDLNYLLQNDEKNAQISKENIEDVQRKYRALREKYNITHK